MSGTVARLIPAFIAFLLLVMSVGAQAALECEQLVSAAQTTVKLRDGGVSLNAVMNDIERGELPQKLDVQEMNLLRQIVRMTYTSEASVYEIFEACKSGELGLPKPKP